MRVGSIICPALTPWRVALGMFGRMARLVNVGAVRVMLAAPALSIPSEPAQSPRSVCLRWTCVLVLRLLVWPWSPMLGIQARAAFRRYSYRLARVWRRTYLHLQSLSRGVLSPLALCVVPSDAVSSCGRAPFAFSVGVAHALVQERTVGGALCTGTCASGAFVP